MGGDFGLRSTIPASVLALNENSELHITLVGDEPAIRAALADSRAPLDRLSIVHAPDVVLMDDKPASALRTKRQSSMAIALELLRDGQVSAVLSAGNTGALVAMSCICPAHGRYSPARDMRSNPLRPPSHLHAGSRRKCRVQC